MRKLCWLFLLLLLTPRAALAGLLYDEAASGDLSNDGLSPTQLGSLQDGDNVVYGTTGRVVATDRDYFTFTVPQGLVWSQLLELPGTQVGGSVSFIGLQAGPQVTVSPNASDATGLLGWAHYGASTVADIELLSVMGTAGLGSTGFTPPLPAGVYSVWIQDFGGGTFSYGFDFHLTPAAPEPTAAPFALFGVALVASVRSARSRRTSSR